jgi:hypothetical protein
VVGVGKPKSRTISSLGIPRSTVVSTLSLRSFEYRFIPARSRMPINPHPSRCQGLGVHEGGARQGGRAGAIRDHAEDAQGWFAHCGYALRGQLP